MPSFERRSKTRRWIWLLAILVVAVLVFLSFRRSRFISRRDTNSQGFTMPQQRTETSGAQTSSNGNSEGLRSVPAQPAGRAIPASDNWYTAVAFKGRVLNEADRTPVDGATVRVYAYSSPSSVVEKTTSAGGTFQIVAPPAYRYEVKVEASGFRSYSEDSFVVTRPYYDLQILLTPTLTLRGRVLDDLSAGISDALVQLQRANDRSSALLAATTDQQGSFTLTDVPRYGRYALEAFHPGYDTMGLVYVAVPPEGDVILRMKPARTAGSLAGAVTDLARRPVAGAEVSLSDSSDGRPLSTVRTDRQGLYRFARMREGYYLVRCAADGFAEARANQGFVAIYANKEARLDFSLDPGLLIKGIVVNDKQEPVIQAEVLVSVDAAPRARMSAPDGADPTGGRAIQRGGMQRMRSVGFTTTDNEGRFQISGLPDSQYQVTVSHRDYQTLVMRLRPSAQPQTLVLDAGLYLRGTVSDASGAAVERFTLTLQSSAGRGEKAYPFTTTDGHFEIHGLVRDTYRVVVQTSGRGRLSGTLDVQASAEVFIMTEPGGGRGQEILKFLKAK